MSTDADQLLSSRLQVTMTTLAGAVGAYALSTHLEGRPAGAYLLVVALLASLLPGVRRAYSRRTLWGLRIGLGVLVLAFTPVVSMPMAFAPLDPAYVHRIGLLVLVELVVRSILTGETVRRSAIRLALGGAVLCAAAVSFDAFPLRYCVPAWMGCVCVALGADDRVVSRRWRLPQVMAVVACLALGYLFTSVVHRYGYRMYVAFDRVTRRDNDARSSGARALAGGNTSGQLRSVFNLGRSEVVALRITGRLGPLHLRGLAFDTYNTRGLWEPSFERTRLRPLTTQPTVVSPVPAADGVRIERVTSPTSLLFYPPGTKRLTLISAGATLVADACGPAVVVPTYEADDTVVSSATYDIDSKESPPGGLTIRLTDALSEESLARCRALPPDLDPRVRALAGRIVGAETDPARVSALVVSYLRRNYAYATEGDFRSSSNDPLATFLFDKQAAHCQYFASASAVLLRCAGVPSRYAVGYYATGEDPINPGSLVAREQDAHAWAEAWDGSAWITVDATPDDGRPDVIYRKTLAERAWEQVARAASAAYAAWLTGELWFVPVGLLLAGTLFFVVRRRRARTIVAGRKAGLRRSDEPLADPRFGAFVVAFDQFLKRHDLSCPSWQTWTEFLNQSRVPIPPGVHDLLNAYSAARFGRGVPPDPAMLESSDLPPSSAPTINGSSP